MLVGEPFLVEQNFGSFLTTCDFRRHRISRLRDRGDGAALASETYPVGVNETESGGRPLFSRGSFLLDERSVKQICRRKGN